MKICSWLFAPNDSEKKTTKVMEGSVGIALFDLKDAVTAENNPLARQMVHDFLTANAAQRERRRVRIMLPKVYGRAFAEKRKPEWKGR